MSDEKRIDPQNDFDYYYYRPEMDISPSPSGFPQIKYKFHFIGLNSDHRCKSGVWYESSGSILLNAEGTYKIDGDEISFSWSDGTSTTGHLSPDHQRLEIDGEVFKAPRKRL